MRHVSRPCTSQQTLRRKDAKRDMRSVNRGFRRLRARRSAVVIMGDLNVKMMGLRA